jgi:hypothetical protein
MKKHVNYYKCVRDMTHYRYKGAIYNFTKGSVLPESEIIKQNLEYFEISNVFTTAPKHEVFRQSHKPDVFLSIGSKKVNLEMVR